MMIGVFSESAERIVENLSKAREIAGSLNQKVAVITFNDDGKKYIEYGADKVIVVNNENLKRIDAMIYSSVLYELCKKYKIDILIVSSTREGKETASRLSAKMDVGCSLECTDVFVEDGRICVTRVVLGGNAVAKEKFIEGKGVIGVAPRTFKAKKFEGRTGDVIEESVKLPESPVNIVKEEEKETETVSLDASEIIVSCGRGLKNKDDLSMIKDLADAVHGEIGCSRPIAADLKWLPKERWIGLSGVKVKPRIYITCGISGQIQHLAGMRDSDIIIAINKDKEAPIFKAADYGIIGDMYKIIPEITKTLKK